MNKRSVLGAYALFIIVVMSRCAVAQTGSSAVKTIQHSSSVFVTEPMIAVNPTDPSNFVTVYSNWHDAITRLAGSSSTTDGGNTWTGTEVPNMRYPNTDQADPSVAFDADGTAYYCHLDIDKSIQNRNSIVVSKSTDKGRTWSNLATDTSVVVEDVLPTQNDKPWITIDRSTGPNRNTQYVAWTRIDNFGDPNHWETYTIYISYKKPGQTYFSSPIQVSSVASNRETAESVFGAFPIVGNDGTLYVFWSREHNPPSSDHSSSIMMRKSTNIEQGFTTSEAAIITNISMSDFVILGGSFPKAHSWPFVAINPIDGSLYMAYGNGGGIYFAKSTNGGSSWTSTVTGFSSYPYNQAWNPFIACNAQGQIAIAYYAANWYQGMNLDNSTAVNVATSSDGGGTFTSHKEGGAGFNPTTWKYTDYIGVAYNNSTYWGVWPQAVGTGADIDGRYRTVTAVVENVDDSQQRNSVANQISFNGTNNLNSPYTTGSLLPGRTYTIETSSPIQYQGITYTFVRWEDETGALISNNLQTSVQVESHRYRAVFSKYMVNVAVKNEFKEPNGAVNNGGTVNIDNVDYVTDNLPGKQKTFTAPQGEIHRLEAKEQAWGSYYRGFNSRLDKGGGWFKDGLPLTGGGQSVLSAVAVQGGTYMATYRNRYTVHVNGSLPETGGTVTDITSPQNVWQYEGAVTAPSQITSGGRTYQFYGWSDGATANPDPNAPTNNSTYTALYKGTHISSDGSAFSNNSQRKLVRTTVGSVNWLHQVYTSSIGGVSHVFIEHSSNDGSSWAIGNNGQPLDNGSGKCPSIDFNGTTLLVAFEQQEALPNTYSIRLSTFIPQSGTYIRQCGPNDLSAYTYYETADAYSTNANLSVAWSPGGYYLTAFEKKSGTSGINCVVGMLNPDGTPHQWGSGGPYHVNGTTGSSIYPTVHSNKWASYTGGEFELAYEQYSASYSSCINETPINVLYTGNWGNSVSQLLSLPGTISSGSFPVNYRPSVVQLDASNNAALCWIRDQSAGRGDPYSVNVVYWNTKSPSVYTTFGLNAQSVSLNLADNSSNAYFSYSQYWNSAWTNYASNGASGVLMTLNTTGQDVQLSNGPIMYGNVKYMYTSAFNRTASPYSFSTSYPIGGNLPKSSPAQLFYGRGGTIGEGGIQFSYSFGNLTVDNKSIDFVDAADSLNYSNLDTLNSVLTTWPFQITSKSNIVFSEDCGFVDSAAAASAFGDNKYIAYKLELIDTVSGRVVGTIKNVKFGSSNTHGNSYVPYLLNTDGIGTKTVKARITFTTNLDTPKVALVKSYSDVTPVSSLNVQSLSLQRLDVITDYRLDQNYPNPFNPSTVISYTIPKEGMVTLKIYDVLGRVVETLANQNQKVGRYEVTFDGSKLASGVYFYRLTSGSQIITKKMLLVK